MQGQIENEGKGFLLQIFQSLFNGLDLLLQFFFVALEFFSYLFLRPEFPPSLMSTTTAASVCFAVFVVPTIVVSVSLSSVFRGAAVSAHTITSLLATDSKVYKFGSLRRLTWFKI